MTSTGHDGPFYDDSSNEHTLVLPAQGTPTPSNSRPSSSSTTNPADSAPYPTAGGDEQKSWKPSVDRQQSWSTQDMKHQMQARLLRTEKGKESGFSKTKP